MFERKLDSVLIEKLEKEDLFINYLLPDIQKGEVFFALRKNEAHFYHKGSRLFKYVQGNFKTHSKFASVINIDKDSDISETDIKNKKYKLIESFSDGYQRIKENCSKYSGVEAAGVSNLFRYSYSLNNNNDIVLLDLEASFEAINEENDKDRIDVVIFNKKTQSIKFIEVKHFSNSEIWSKAGKKPKVVEQIIRYEKNIPTKEQEIVSAYNNDLKLKNSILGLDDSLPEVKHIEEKVVLLIFGFDSDQQNKKAFKRRWQLAVLWK